VKKLWLVLGILFLSVVLFGLVGCNGVTPPPEEPPLDLIREYTGTDVVVRWPDGVISVCDTTGETKEIWEKINGIIGGPVVFEQTNDTAAQKGIAIEYQPIGGVFFVGFPQMGYNTFEGCGVIINPATASDDVFVGAVLVAVGINIEKWTEGFTQEMKTVLYWLYQLPPGTSLE
jgi:hypothetical protein